MVDQVGVGAGFSMLFAVIAFSGLRHWCRRIAVRDRPIEDRVHLLRRIMIGSAVLSLLVGVVLGGGTTEAAGTLTAPSAWEIAGGIVLAVIAYGAPLAATMWATRPPLAALRDVPLRPEQLGRQIAAGVLSAAVTLAVFALGLYLSPRHGAGRLLGLAATYAVLLLLVQSLVVPLSLRIGGARALDPELEARLRSLADKMAARVRVFYLVPDRRRRVANAIQIGLLPGLRYVVLTEYLVQNMTAAQIDAVTAHELGHVRGRHVALKLAAVLGTWGGLEAVLALTAGRHGALTESAYLLALLGLPVAVVVVNGLLGIALERRADDAAAREVGDQPLATALTKIGRLNHTPAITGRFWNLLTQHPGLNSRIVRLQADDAAASPAKEAAQH